MRLLIVTQEMDTESKTLSFFHAWVEALAPHYDSVEVICLKEGTHTLPQNVHVHSLGKEKGAVPSFMYVWRFLSLVWKLRRAYDAVFVHMNQEYILIAGLLWKWLRKPVYLWRNHYAGSVLTDIAAYFCAKVFCTSKHSYTARYKKTVLMPVGVNIRAFAHGAERSRTQNSILFLARLSPSKNLDMFIDALLVLHRKGVAFTATVVGTPLPQHEAYVYRENERIVRAGLEHCVTFRPGVPHEKTIEQFATHGIFVNCSQSGMFDKTLFEAAASGCLVLAVSRDFARLTAGESSFTGAEELAVRLEELIGLSAGVWSERARALHMLAKAHSLENLCERLASELYSTYV